MRLKSGSMNARDNNALHITISRETSENPRQTTRPAQAVGAKVLEHLKGLGTIGGVG